jgi:ADP-ribosylation factor GTPase-activating protein 2/3
MPTLPQAEDEDFFTSWDKSKTPTPNSSVAPSPKPATPNISRSASPAIAPAVAAPQPRTVTSSSMRSSAAPGGNGRTLGGVSRLNSSSSTTSSSTSAGPKKTKLGGLGGVKKAAPVDFAEAERRAVEEAERIKQLGYDRQREEEEEKARQEAEKIRKATEIGPSKIVSNGTTSTIARPNGNNADVERLGMGMRKLGFGALPVAAAGASPPSISRTRYAH